jgi:hypothetical protein
MTDSTKDIIILIAVSLGLGVLSGSRFFTSPVERCLNEWAKTLNCQLLDYRDPAFGEQFHRPLSWLWAPWGIWRVTVRDRTGLERVAVVRIRGLRPVPATVDVRWEKPWSSGLTSA